MKIVISRKVPRAGIELLRRQGYDIVQNNSREPWDRDVLLDHCRDADALWSLLDDTIDQQFLSQCKNLKIVANYAVGHDNIDVEYARKQGIVVTITPGTLTNATADLAFALLLGVARRIVEGHRFVTEGKFEGWDSTLLLGSELAGKTLGVLGAGRIGSAVAKRALGFEMDVIYHSRNPKPHLDSRGCTFVDLDTIIMESDYLSLHLPLTDDTNLLLGIHELRRMKPGSYLINTGRGKLVDEQALVDMLKQGHLAGAGLDVYQLEPEVHPELVDMGNVILLPHIGSATVHARETMSKMCAQAIIDLFEGKDPKHTVG